MNGLMEELFDTVTKSVSVPLDRLTQAERTQIIARLYDQGMFELRGAVRLRYTSWHVRRRAFTGISRKSNRQTE